MHVNILMHQFKLLSRMIVCSLGGTERKPSNNSIKRRNETCMIRIKITFNDSLKITETTGISWIESGR